MEDAEEVPAEQASSLSHSQFLFPVAISQSQTSSNSVSGWIQNMSFTADSSTIDEKVNSEIAASCTTRLFPDEEIVEERNLISKYPLISEVEEVKDYDGGLDDGERTTDSGSDGLKKKRESKRKKKRKRKRIEHERETSTRKSNVRHWANSNIKSSKEYYLDTQGDRDNLVYGSLYRVDVPRYKLGFASKSYSSETEVFKYAKKSVLSNMDDDADALDNQLKSSGRYWSAKYVAVERHKNFKRLRLLQPRRSSYAAAEDFLPLLDAEKLGDYHSSSFPIIEESWEDEVLRKTREFNSLTRERPHDENLWIEFSEFQDKVAEKQPQKGAKLQTLEKKISILENAIQLNPESEELLLHLLKSCQRKDTTSVLIDRWNRVLTQRSWSPKLWKEYLAVVQGEFSTFKVSEMRKAFVHAIQALSTACRKHSRQVASISEPENRDSNVELELGLVDIFLSLCRFEWQAGYQELATALLQAEIEFSLCCPTLILSEGSKLRLFEHYWISSGARLGEEESLGWSSWLETEENERQRILKEQSLINNEKGDWSGWLDTLSKSIENVESMDNTKMGKEVKESEDEDEDAEADEVEEDDAEALLKQLGIDVDADADAEIKDSKTWAKWSEVEAARDSTHWMPIHVKPDSEMETAPGVVLFEDICDFLFSLTSKEAHFSLISQFVLFFGGELSEWVCTNSSTWGSRMLGSDTLVDPMLLNLQDVVFTSPQEQPSIHNNLGDFVIRSLNKSLSSKEMAKFLRKAILLLMDKFPEHYVFKEAVLVAQEHSEKNSSRSLAKSLIKSNRQDVMLCGVYAKREAVAGNMDHARRAFDMAVCSVEGLPLDLRSEAPLLFFWYAEAELSKTYGCNDEASSRALHILSTLGCGSKYVPFVTKPSSLQILRAHQGFKDKTKLIRSEFARGKMDDQSISIICSAALFEELTAGWSSGVSVLDEAFNVILAEQRSNNGQVEFLYIFYVRMLIRNKKQCGLAKVWQSVLKGLEIYPKNPELYKNLLQISLPFTTPNKLRSLLDTFTHREPSIVVWVFTLLFEINREGSRNRVHRLFERVFADANFRNCVVLWRLYIAYEVDIASNLQAAKRAFFRAIHACPWSKKLWLDGFEKLNTVLTPKELSDLQEVMRDKELNLRTDIYEILLQDDLDA